MKRSFVSSMLVLVTLLALLVGSAAFPTSAHAGAAITVNSTADNISGDGLCTLREAMNNANANVTIYGDCAATGYGDDTIIFAESLGSIATITLVLELPTITDTAELTIDGDNRITLSGNNSVRVFDVNHGVLTLQNLRVTYGKAVSGGGLYNYYGGVTITNSTFASNSATSGSGGGVSNIEGALTITHSAFFNNSASSGGGGIYNGFTLTIANSTFSNNSANSGGGVENNSGTATILNSTFSDNTAAYHGGAISTYKGGVPPPVTTIRNTILANSAAGGDCNNDASGTLIGGNNIIEATSTCTSIATITDDPMLGALTGSPTYFPLNGGSPAINTGDDDICAAAPVNNTSQNGITRPQGVHCDIGSYEHDLKFFTDPSRLTTAFDLSHGWTVQNFVRTLGDVDGGGTADLIGFGLDGVYVALSTEDSGFGLATRWSTAFDLSHGWTVQDYVRTVGDVNNDGRADLIGFGADGVYVALSTGTGFGAVAQWSTSFGLANGWTVQNYVRTVGDVNNDGRADLIGFGLDGVYVALSTGTTFGAATRWSTGFDLSHGWTVQNFVRTLGDVNNDGRADLIGFGADGVYVALAPSTGTAFGPVAQWSTGFGLANGWTVQSFVRTLGDVTGDGKADLVGFGADGVYVALAPSTGTAFGPVAQWSTGFGLANGWTVQDFVRTLGDVTGDGKADLVGFGADGVYVAIAQ